jgi:release factor glutamine methyltransferase
MPGVSCVALDVNPVAVELSMENAKEALSDYSRYSCILKDFLEYAKDPSQNGTFDVIVSNPPYIPSDEMLDLSSEVSDYEDHRALHGGEDGMDLIREIIELGPELLSDEGPGELWLEVARRHPDAIEEYVRQYNAELDHQNDKRKRFYFVEGINDLSNNPRFARLRLR